MWVCCCVSDQMGNKGAFITMSSDLKPNFTTYEAVVCDKCIEGCIPIIQKSNVLRDASIQYKSLIY